MKKFLILVISILLFFNCAKKKNNRVKESSIVKKETESQIKPKVEEKPVNLIETSPAKPNIAKIIGSGCRYRNQAKISNSVVLGVVEAGEEYEIVDKKGYWAKVVIGEGSRHKGKKGYMWTERIKNPKVGNSLVTGLGVRLRKEPKKNDNIIAAIRAGANVLVVSIKISRVKIQGEYKKGKFVNGWVPIKYIERKN